MARYFKYKTAADLAADAAGRGVRLELADDLSPLFAPLDVPLPNGGTFTLGNRLAVQPMEGCDGTPDGRPGDLTRRRYRRFGAGGAKLIWGEATAVCDDGRMNPRQLWLAEHSADEIAAMFGRLPRRPPRGVRRRRRPARRPATDALRPVQLSRPQTARPRPPARPADGR